MNKKNGSKVALCFIVSALRFKPAMGRPEARTRFFGAQQLHGRNWVVEKVAEAEHGTDQNTGGSTTILEADQADADRFACSVNKISCEPVFKNLSK